MTHGPFGTPLNDEHVFFKMAKVLCYIPERGGEDTLVRVLAISSELPVAQGPIDQTFLESKAPRHGDEVPTDGLCLSLKDRWRDQRRVLAAASAPVAAPMANHLAPLRRRYQNPPPRAAWRAASRSIISAETLARSSLRSCRAAASSC